MNWWLFFRTVLKSVLLSTGGFGPLPILHADFIARGWASEKQFTEALAIGQITPGPNGLWVASFCYLVAGIPGAALSCLAMLLPPLLILVVELCYLRIRERAETQGALDGMMLVIAGTNVLLLARFFLGSGPDALLVAIAACSAALAASGKVPAIAIVAASALLGFFVLA